jgi:hypothetical protein
MKSYLGTPLTRYAGLILLLLVSGACQGSGGDEPDPGTAGTFSSSAGAAGSGAGAIGAAGAAGAANEGGAAGSMNVAGTANQAGSAGSMISTGGAGAAGGSAGAAGGSAGAAGGSAGAAGGSAGAGGEGTGPFPVGVTKPRIMIVGDSISAGPGCYKKYLLKNLTDSGYSKLEFVGEYTDDCGGGVRHSAVSCSNAEQYTHDTFMMPNCQQGKSFSGMAPLVTKHDPDLIMLQLGVNDVWGGTPTATTLGRYKTLIEQARAKNPQIVTVVAQIQKIRPGCGSDDSVQKRAEELVKAVPAWAQQLSTTQSPVFVADLWTNSDFNEADDCVHPNDVGARRMGMNWFNALKTILTPG